MSMLENIIQEQIENFLKEEFMQEDFFAEKKKKHKAKHKKNGHAAKEKSIKRKGKKLKRGLRTDYNAKLDRETNPNLTNQDAEDINKILDSDYINLAAVAQDVYPDHTRQGAQSQLRKKVKGLKSDSGSTYKLKKKEANKIRRAIAKQL